MPDGSRTDAGRRFAHDLRALREERGLSLEDVHEQTRLPRPLIASFEEDGLIDRPMFNRVYLRSFVRTYAELLAVSPARVLVALERALEGTYDGSLLHGEEDLPGSEADGDAGSAHPAPNAPVAEVRPSRALGGEAEAAGSAASASRASSAEDEPARSPEDTEVDASWSAQSPPDGELRAEAASGGAASSAGPSRKTARAASPVLGWAGLAAALAVLAAVAFLIVRAFSAEQTAETPVAVQPPDTLAGSDARANRPPLANLALGETMLFTVVASEGRVSPIRITRDSDLRRPYWIEEGRATVFPAEDRIVLEQQLDSVRLFLNGYPFPLDRRDEQGRVVVTRETAQTFADTVRGAPVRLSVAADTNRIPTRR